MLRFFACALLLFIGISQPAMTQEPQILELRTYTLSSSDAEPALDEYLEKALIPALVRQGLGPIGALDQAAEAEDGSVQVLLLIPGPTVEAVTGATAKLADDEQYQQAAKEYLATPADKPVLKRIRSELLRSFECWPEVAVPKQKDDDDRLFEMRVYESATEQLGELKVEMFNSGEVPIFLDCGIAPVFMGQALIGDQMPNLTYMTVYDNDESRTECWKKFRVHPDWQVLKEVKKYANTVSKIHKSDWTAKSYSQL